MKKHLIELLNQNLNGLDVHELARLLECEQAQDFVALNKLLNELSDELEIYEDENHRYFSCEALKLKTGSLMIKRSGDAFIDDDERGLLEIDKQALKGAMDKDVVLYQASHKRAKIFKIIKHNIDCVVGLIRIRQGKVYFYPDDIRLKDYKITNLKQFKLNDKVKVRCFITDYEKKELKLESVIASLDDPQARELSILYSYNVPMSFSSTVENETKTFKSKILLEDYPERRNLTNQLVITIDGDDAKDFDDAICVEKDGDDYVLWVHIADVSYYVTKNSAIDKSAYERGTSIYYADHVLPMLPFALSNELCSLKPNENRLALSVKMVINAQGEVKDTEIFESVIESKYRMTYTNVNSILEGDHTLCAKYAELVPMIHDAYKLSRIIRKRREDGGSIDFDENESQLIIKNHKVVDIKPRVRGEAEKMIEDFMISANVAVATYMKYLDYPMIYRNHDYPKEERLLQFVEVLEGLGYVFKGNKYQIKGKQLRDCLNYYRDTDMEMIVSNLMLRSMAKAVYDNVSIGHYGLGLEDYCHFTSPIRRYPDLMVHRMVKKYVLSSDHYDEIEKDTKINQNIAKAMSEKERRAVAIERDVIDLKKCEFMADKVGQVYDGIISSVVSFGFFVKLENTVEGLVHVSNLDGFYEFDEKLGVLRSGNYTYQVGQRVRVKCIDVDLRRQTIDFVIFKKKRIQRWI